MALTDGGPVGRIGDARDAGLQADFVLGRCGYGAALALILTVLIAGLALTQLALLRRNEQRL